jgi:hypothetical protein
MSTSKVKAAQLTASGLVTGKRALFKQLLVHHSGGGDTEIKFYDLTAAPVGGEPYYDFDVYGKGMFVLPIPEPGVLFDDGIYVAFTAVDLTATIFYEEV